MLLRHIQDVWRFERLLSSLSSPDHPYSHFHTGDLSTLNHTGIEQELKTFYET